MFISVKRGVFEKDTEDEINNSIKQIEQRIDSTKTKSIKRTIDIKKIEIDNSYENNSNLIGEQVVLCFTVLPQYTTAKIPIQFAPSSDFLTEAFDGSQIKRVQVKSSGEVVIPAHSSNIYIYCTYII